MAQDELTRSLAPSVRRPSRLRGLHSLQFKASLLIVLLILLISMGGMFLSLQATRSALLESDSNRAESWALSLAANTSEEVAAGDRAALLGAANTSIQLHKAAYVVFADRKGVVLASAEACAGLVAKVSKPLGAERQLDLGPMRRVEIGQHAPNNLTYMETVVPVQLVQHEGGPAAPRLLVGYLRCAIDISDTPARLRRTANALIRMALAILLLVVPCSLLATRRVVGPVLALAKAAHALAKGALDARAPVGGRDEIGELAMAFNYMADKMTATQYELMELNADLERRVAERTRELEEQAARDPLTGLYNRRHFGEVITREFAAAERYGPDLTCLMFDVDHFKEINDQYGHRTGDKVLITLADSLSAELRASDVAARFGGDEFILLLPQTASHQASTLAERIVERFNHNLATTAPGVAVTVSIGVASLHTTRARSSEALIHEADIALYAAKEGGRNRTHQAIPLKR